MQNLQVQSKDEIKAILSRLRTDRITVEIRATKDGFKQSVSMFVSKKEMLIQSEIKTMSNAGFNITSIQGFKKTAFVVTFEKELSNQALTIIEEETS